MDKDAPSPQPTSTLVRQARGGDEAALAALVGRFQPRVFRVVRRRIGPRLRSQLESGDVVQDVMVQAIRSIQDFVPQNDRSFFRWLAQIVENRLRNSARKMQRKPLELANTQVLQRPAPTEKIHLDADREREALARALETLSEDHRRVIHLRNFARLSFAEVGENMDRTEGAAFALHKRATAELVKVMRKAASS